MAVTARVDVKDELYLKNMLQRAERKSVRFANRMIKNIALRFFISARKWTGPDRASKISKMRKKHRIRPVVTLTMQKQHMLGQYWYKDRSSGKIFARRSPISKKSRFNQTLGELEAFTETGQARIIPLKRAIKMYSKKRKRFVYVGTELSRGLHAGRRDTKIPAAGAAKAGWIQGMKALGNRKGTRIGRISPKVGTTRWKKGANPIIKHRNEVDYVSNISPGVMAKSMNKAANWFRAKEKKKFEKMVGKEYKN